MKSIISSVIYTSIPVSKVIFFPHIKSRIELQNQWLFFSSFVMEIIPNVSSYTTVSNYITKSMTIPSCLELHRIIPRISVTLSQGMTIPSYLELHHELRLIT